MQSSTVSEPSPGRGGEAGAAASASGAAAGPTAAGSAAATPGHPSAVGGRGVLSTVQRHPRTELCSHPRKERRRRFGAPPDKPPSAGHHRSGGRAQPWGVPRPGPIPRHPSIESTDAERCRASSAAAEALGVAGLGAGAAGPPASTEASARRSASGGRAAGRGAGRRCSAAGGGVVRTQTVAVAVRHLLLVGESVECVKGPHGCVGGGKRKSNPKEPSDRPTKQTLPVPCASLGGSAMVTAVPCVGSPLPPREADRDVRPFVDAG